MKLKILTQKEFVKLREKQLKKQGGKCAILGVSLKKKDVCFDHKHKTKAQECGGEEGLGCLRGVLHKNANSFEGKLERTWKRYGLNKVISLPDLLRRCADYIECPPMKPEYIHPKEKPDNRRKLKKTEYKRVLKYWPRMFPRRKKLPEFPKSGFANKQWEEWIQKANDLYELDKWVKQEKKSARKNSKNENR
ncbi:MAG: endonuclease domain-containing protein [Bacteriovoracaceae bacterium]